MQSERLSLCLVVKPCDCVIAKDNLILGTKYIKDSFVYRTFMDLASLGKEFRDFIYSSGE